MTVEVIAKQEMMKLLNDWYQEMRVQHVMKATKLKAEIDGKIARIEEDQDVLLYYSLLEFRHQMLLGDFQADFNHPILEQQTNIFLKYYYHFFKFIYSTEIGNYSDAKQHYKLAEELLAHMPDEAEKAEFNYRVAIFNYYLSQPVLAIHYATKAQEFFSQHKGYEVKKGACKNVLGMACNTLAQYELAEEYLLEALDIFKKAHEDSLVIKIKHNLGLLYADQDLSEIAIRHLSEIYNENRSIRATYLLAREHYKLKNKQETSKYIEEGLNGCSEEYKYHLSVLKAKNDNLPVEAAEGIFLSAIEYLKKREMWKDVIMYSEELANKWFDVDDKEKTITYFRMSYEAKQILHKKGALK